MTCPACGGGTFAQVGLNYVTCAEPRVAVVPQQYPLPPKEIVYVCATPYQIGVAMDIPQCACGTFAIGQCKDCGVFVCGSHSGLYGGLRFCESDHMQRYLKDNPADEPLPGGPEDRKAQREAQAQADLAAMRARKNRDV